MSAPSLIVGFVAVLVSVAAGIVFTAPAALAGEGCENEARRVEQGSTFLPDCRAYELVSQPSQPSPYYYHYSEGVAPKDSDGFDFPEEPYSLPKVQSSVWPAVDGNAVLFEGAQANSQGAGKRNNLSRRGPNGWTGENIEPPQSRHGFLCGVSGYEGFSQDLEQVAFIDGKTEDELGKPDSIEDCGHEEPSLVSGEPERSGNLFLRDTATGSFQLVNVTPPGAKSYQPWFDATSADGSDVLFNSRARLTADAPNDEALNPGGTNGHCKGEFGDIYVWSAGTVHLLTVLPDGTAVGGSLAGAHLFECDVPGPESADVTHALSSDGERVLFYAGGGFELVKQETEQRPEAPYIDGGLYLREHPGTEQSALNGSGQCTEPAKACTIQVDVDQRGTGTSGNGTFQWANAETTEIFFTDEEKLTPDSTAVAGRPDLYEYDLEKPEGQRLTDLTANAAEPADVLGVSGVSEDGSYVYFAAQGDLTGSQQNSHGDTALAPAQGSGTLSGFAEGTGTGTGGSNQVTGLSVESGEFRVGQEIEGGHVPLLTTVTACTPDCSAPTGLTLSRQISGEQSESVHLTGRGSNEITGVSATSGAFNVGMELGGSGISPGTWITEAGAGTITLSRGVTANGAQALSATAGNLYLRHAGTTTFIAALATEADRCDWTMFCLTARVSQNGAYVAFDSFARLTGYDNLPVHPEACEPLTLILKSPCPETFRYAEAGGAKGELTCASCDPSGAPPASEFGWSIIGQAKRGLGQSYPIQLSDNISNKGEVFFDTMERLLPADRNETWDVYQYDDGEGPSAQLHLISSGESGLPSYFMNATPDGSNVFFVTFQPLLRADTRTDYDIYDARVNGGFASQSEAVQPPACEALEACRSPLSEPPAEFSVASAALAGGGNLASAPSGQPVVKKPVVSLTRAQELADALKACKGKSKSKRAKCEKTAREKYGTAKKQTAKSKKFAAKRSSNDRRANR